MDPSAPIPPEWFHENKWNDVFIPTTVTYTLATVAIILRFGSGAIVKKTFWWDDYAAIFSWICGTAIYFSIAIGWKNIGYGRHVAVVIATIDPDVFTKFFKYVYALELLYAFTITTAKVSIIALLWRIFSKTTMRYWLIGLLVICVSWGIAVVFACIFPCIPVQAFWDITITNKKCIDVYKFYIGITFPNMLTDFSLVLLPIPYVWPLQVSVKQKIMVGITLVCGGATSIISAIRLAKIMNNFSMADPTWDSVTFMIWSDVECYCAIISICLPTFRPLIRWLAGHSLGSAANSSGPSRSSGPSFKFSFSGKHKEQHRPRNWNTEFEAESERELTTTYSNEEPEVPSYPLRNVERTKTQWRQMNRQEPGQTPTQM